MRQTPEARLPESVVIEMKAMTDAGVPENIARGINVARGWVVLALRDIKSRAGDVTHIPWGGINPIK